jgi:hypothetical protein
MTTRSLTARLAALAFAALAAAGAQAQNIWAANAQFDAQQAAILGRMQQQNTQSQAQLWQYHLRTNGPRLQREYAQLVASGQAVGSFEQYAYYDLMTARGTNVQAALDNQRINYEGRRQANDTVRGAYEASNIAWQDRSQRQMAAVENHTNGAVRGVAPYVDPNTGRATMLPNYLPQGQAVQINGNVYAQDASGQYYRRDNNGWVRLNAAR